MSKKDSWILPWIVVCSWLASFGAQAATVFDTTDLVGATVSDNSRLPDPIAFTVATAGDYKITLRDLLTPQALKSLRAIVTRDLSVVAQVDVTAVTAPQEPQPATQTFAATPGTYRIHVLAIPADAAVGGGFGVSVAPAAGGVSIVDEADVVAPPSVPGSGQSALQATFTITQAGSHQLTLTDLQFPAALVSTQVLLLLETPSGVSPVLFGAGTFDAVAGTYQLLILAKAPDASPSGLYNVRVTGPGTAVVYESTQPVGNLSPPTDVTITGAGAHVFALHDAEFPESLAALSAVVTQNGSVLEDPDENSVFGEGEWDVSPALGAVQVYVNATPNAIAQVGAYSVSLTRGQAVLADVEIVDASADPTTPAIYSATTSTAVAAGSYRLDVKDFDFPLPFQSLKTAIAQGAAVIDRRSGEGSAQFDLQAAPLKVLIAVSQRPEDNALFGVTVTAAGATQPVLDATQGVGGLFRSQPVQITTAGLHDITLQDLAFPAAMGEKFLAVTRGTDLIAQIIGAGTVTKQQLDVGTYTFNFFGKPGTGQSYGAYGFSAATSPPVPTVTLAAASTSITSGQSTTLQWSAADATACTASGGWSGAKNVSGSQSTGALTANTTFDLSCTGPGGTANASVAVTVSPPSRNGGGGGGAMNLLLMMMLGGLAALRLQLRR